MNAEDPLYFARCLVLSVTGAAVRVAGCGLQREVWRRFDAGARREVLSVAVGDKRPLVGGQGAQFSEGTHDADLGHGVEAA